MTQRSSGSQQNNQEPSNASSSLSLLFYSATPLASTLYCAQKCCSRALDIHCCPGLTQRALIHIYIAARRVSIRIYDVMWTTRSGTSHQTLIWPRNTNLVPELVSFLIQKSKLPQPITTHTLFLHQCARTASAAWRIQSYARVSQD